MSTNVFVTLYILSILTLSALSVPNGSSSVPFDRVFTMGILRKRLQLVTGTQDASSDVNPQVYELNPKLLSHKGQLLLVNAKSTPLVKLRPHLDYLSDSFRVHIPFDHFWTLTDKATKQEFLLFDFYEPANDQRIAISLNYTAGNDTYSYEFKFDRILNHNETWISSTEPMTVYALSRSEATIVKYQCIFETYYGYPGFFLLQYIKEISPRLWMCSKSYELNDRSLTMEKDQCDYPVQWNVTSGFVGRKKFYFFDHGKVYIFNKTIFDKAAEVQDKSIEPDASEQYLERTFHDFFFNEHLFDVTTTTSTFAPLQIGKVVGIIGIIGLVIIVVILVALVMLWYTQNENTQVANPKPEEPAMPNQLANEGGGQAVKPKEKSAMSAKIKSAANSQTKKMAKLIKEMLALQPNYQNETILKSPKTNMEMGLEKSKAKQKYPKDSSRTLKKGEFTKGNMKKGQRSNSKSAKKGVTSKKTAKNKTANSSKRQPKM